MLYIVIILALVLIILIIGKANVFFQFDKEVKQLFSQSKNISGKTFRYEQLTGLPEIVQGYFKHVLKEDQPYISYVRLIHDGLFKTNKDKDWVKIVGEQYFTTQKPGFIWKGKTSLFTARDMFLTDRGRLIVSLFSSLKIVKAQGEKYDNGELLRWLAESVWFPTNLLPGNDLHWTSIDNLSARLTFHYKNLSISYIVTFNNIGEIVQMETKRYMGEENLETWIIKLADYKTINGIVIPTTAEAIWRLEKADFSYAKFNVKKIEYDKAEKF